MITRCLFRTRANDASIRRVVGSLPAGRYFPQCFSRRAYSAVPPPPPTSESQPFKPQDLRSQFPSAPSPPPRYDTQSKAKRSLRPFIYATIFLFIGLSAGQYVRLVVSPPPLPTADSREDHLMVEFLHKEGEKLPIVQSLSADPSWQWHDAYTSLPTDERNLRLTTGPLAGARALGGFQRIFSNKTTGELIAVIWFGGAVAGWPGVTHGGLVATVLDEQLGRCAVRQLPSQTGVTANLEINYRKPVLTNSYYIVRTLPEKETFTETKVWVSGKLETLDGKVCAEARALYVVPKKYQTKVFTGEF